MRINLNKFALVSYLIAAVLALNWSNAHLHLSEQHDHGDSIHFHDVAAHTHPVTGGHHHQDSLIDVSLNENNASIIELEHEANNISPVKFELSKVLLLPVRLPFVPHSLSETEFPELISSKLGYLFRSTVFLRGPPQVS